MIGTMTKDAPLRKELTPLPWGIRSLPIFRGYPVPWFVAWFNGEPEFRAADKQKFRVALKDKRCWVCGKALGKTMTFVAGPMCGINRTSAEPPCHLECAKWSAINCPFLSKPRMVRRENNLPENAEDAAGFAIMRNPGVTLLWTTRSYELFGDGKGGVLLEMGEPLSVLWYAEGKPATRQQIEASVTSGLPSLEELARTQVGAIEELASRRLVLEKLYPAA